MRLVLQKLMVHLSESGKDINKNTGSLVQKTFDIAQAIGNESLILEKLIYKKVLKLEARITRPKVIDELFFQLPEVKEKAL